MDYDVAENEKLSFSPQKREQFELEGVKIGEKRGGRQKKKKKTSSGFHDGPNVLEEAKRREIGCWCTILERRGTEILEKGFFCKIWSFLERGRVFEKLVLQEIPESMDSESSWTPQLGAVRPQLSLSKNQISLFFKSNLTE